jgi:hypothetical protein
LWVCVWWFIQAYSVVRLYTVAALIQAFSTAFVYSHG